MTIKELKKALSDFSDDTEVLISDGIKMNFYRGNFEILPFHDSFDDKNYCDIGIGGLD